MPKLSVLLITLFLSTLMPTAQAWHIEDYVTEDGVKSFRVVEDKWDHQPAKSISDEEIARRKAAEKNRKLKPVEVFVIDEEQGQMVIYDQTNSRKWRCSNGSGQKVCRRVYDE